MHLQGRLAITKHKKKQETSFIPVRATNAQIHADNAVRGKIAQPEVREQFKLKRFKEVEPRTSTKRGEKAFMVQAKKQTATGAA